jgi:hypothetical protein
MRKILVAFCITFLSYTVQAKETSGNDLFKLLKEHEKFFLGDSSIDERASGIYMGYVQGVAEVYQHQGLICVPDMFFDNYPLTTSVAKFLMDNTDKLELPARELVYNALVDEFPCKK